MSAKFFLSAVILLICNVVAAQTAVPAPPQETAPGKGAVIFERHLDEAAMPAVSGVATPAAAALPDVTDAERGALHFTAYDLDARLTPMTSGLAMRARVTLRNDGAVPLTKLPLQVSSTLTWESVTLVADGARTRLPLVQHLIDTDADHTGEASEVIVTLPVPLAAGALVTLDTFYSGTITQNANRLERIGASAGEAAQADWDAVGPGATALRGFGNVLWYPVAAPQLFLGQGAQLFEAIGTTRLLQAKATVHLRLSVEYVGDPPTAAYFCGRRKPLVAATDNAEAPVMSSPGIATADFAAAPLGFRGMSLFVAESPETLLPKTREATSNEPSLAVETNNDAQLPLLTASARDAAVVLQEWLGLQPLSSLAIIDHAGQPFEDGPLVVGPLAGLTAPEAAPALTHSLSHAWLETGMPWMDEGLAQFFVLLSIERTKGREAAEAQLESLVQPLAIAEIAPVAGQPAAVGQPLTSASSEMYYRRKAAAMWWMLRSIAGDDALKPALQAWRVRAASRNTPEQEALVFEGDLEKASGKDLHWFFDDWVLHDRGLPDLSFVEVSPRELVSSNGRANGWVIAVSVRNEGAAVADVPLIVRSGTFSTTQRMRIPGFATVTQRVLVEAPPTEVVLNDGTTPEQRTALHTRTVVVHGR